MSVKGFDNLCDKRMTDDILIGEEYSLYPFDIPYATDKVLQKLLAPTFWQSKTHKG